MPAVYLFTLHRSETDPEIKAAMLAEAPQDAAGYWGGKYAPPPKAHYFDGSYWGITDNVVCSSTDKHALGICGSVAFDPVLFREYTNSEVGSIGWDPGPVYERATLTLHNSSPPKPITLIMRRHHVHVDSSVLTLMYHRWLRAAA